MATFIDIFKELIDQLDRERSEEFWFRYKNKNWEVHTLSDEQVMVKNPNAKGLISKL